MDARSDDLRDLNRTLDQVRCSLLPQIRSPLIVGPTTRIQEIFEQNQRSLSTISSQIAASSAAIKLSTGYAELARAMQRETTLSKLAVNIPPIAEKERLFSKYQAFSDSIGFQATKWRSLMEALDASALRTRIPESSFEQFKRSALVWNSGISEAVKRFSASNLLATRYDLCIRLLEPSRVFSRFAEETLAKMEVASGIRAFRALNASIALADAQHLANVDLLTEFATNVVDGEELTEPRLLSAPFIQQAELLVAPDLEEDEDIDSLVLRSPAARAAEKARSVLCLTTSCNKASRLKGKEEIFKPTTKVLEVFAELPWLAPETEKGLGDFIDCLFFVLYEGAGDDKLRFLADNGGPLGVTDCDFIWNLKHLRNKWLRHDIDHGKQSKIDKSWGELGTALKSLGCDGLPRSRDDFRRLHMRMLEESESFLNRMLDAF